MTFENTYLRELLETYFCTNYVIGHVFGIRTRTGRDWHKCVSVMTMGGKNVFKIV